MFLHRPRPASRRRAGAPASAISARQLRAHEHQPLGPRAAVPAAAARSCSAMKASSTPRRFLRSAGPGRRGCRYLSCGDRPNRAISGASRRPAATGAKSSFRPLSTVVTLRSSARPSASRSRRVRSETQATTSALARPLDNQPLEQPRRSSPTCQPSTMPWAACTAITSWQVTTLGLASHPRDVHAVGVIGDMHHVGPAHLARAARE